MPTYSWGAGGTTRSTFTGSAGDGWYTPNLNVPDVRAIYDGTRPIRIYQVAATAGSGDRIYRYALGSSGWISSGFHNITPSSKFSFRVTRNSGTINLGLSSNSNFTTYWVSSGDPVNWNPNGLQPGTMTWYQAPSAPTVNSITPSTTTAGNVAINISPPSDNGGTSITTYTHQFSSNSGFTAIIKEQKSPASTTTFTGLPTGQTIYHRVMAVNAVTDGVSKKGGAASTTKSFSLGTAPVSAAGITVSATPLGTGATVKISPPSNTGGLPITNYNFQREYLAPSPIPSPATVTTTTTSLTNNVSGLTPGATYRWRVRANNAVGAGPYSAWVTLVQPAPSTNPGDYFDGSTPDTSQTTFDWTGTVNNSISYAETFYPTGWNATHVTGELFAGALSRAVGGLFGTYSALYTFFTDSLTPGMQIGIADPTFAAYYAEVAEGQTYWGSIHVNPSRLQRLVCEIAWYTSGDALIGTTLGTATQVGPGVWTRLTATASAPNGAAKATVRIRDVAGTGWSPWLGGDQVFLDGAMLSLGELYPYFDGSTGDSLDFTYNWTGLTDRSTSTRTSVDKTGIDPLADPDCELPPSPPRPPFVPSECIDDVGTWRRYWAVIPSTEVSAWLTVLPTLEIRTRAADTRQVRIRVYPNPFDYAPEQVDTAEWCAEQIISYIPPNTIFTIDGVTQRAWAEVNGRAALNADHLLYGTNGAPPTWPSLSCGISYLVSYDIPLTAPEDNFDTRLYLTQRT